MYKKAGGIIVVIGFVFFVFGSIVGTIASGKGVVPLFISMFGILGFLGLIAGSILYFMGKSQEKKLSKQNKNDSAPGSPVFCSKCGSKAKLDAKFCDTCGTAMGR